MNNVSGYSPAPIYGQIPAVKSQMLFYTVGGYVLLITLNSAILNFFIFLFFFFIKFDALQRNRQ